MPKKNRPLTARDCQPFRYPGGKTKLAKNPAFTALLDSIVKDSDTFYEGFVGSGAISLYVALKYPNKKIVVTDLDKTVSGFWELVAYGSNDEIEQLEALITGFSKMPVVRNNKKAFHLYPNEAEPSYEPPNLRKVEYFRALGTLKDEAQSRVDRAFMAIFFNRTTFSGIAMSQPIGGFKQSSEWTVDCRYNADLLIEKFHNLRELFLGRLTATNEDVIQWLKHLPEGQPTFLDPPYFVQGKVLYPIAMDDFQHKALAEVLCTRTNWIMSYDICDEITKLYDTAQLLRIPFRYSINGKKEKEGLGWNNKLEYLICSPEINTSTFENELNRKL